MPVAGTTTWKSMISTKGNRYRVFLVLCMGFMSQWSGNGLVAYCKSSRQKHNQVAHSPITTS